MSKLGIKPFLTGFVPLAGFDINAKKIYFDIEINKEKSIEEIKQAYSKSLALAVNLEYFSKDTIGFIIAKAVSHEKTLNKIISGETEETSEVQAPENQEIKQEKEEVPATEGLASLFG